LLWLLRGWQAERWEQGRARAGVTATEQGTP